MLVFLSHNYKDKSIVEPIAVRLAEVYGQNNVFYDSWSIQPGDGIIDKMNEGINEMSFFFFFVSRNSLESNMVKLEWQNALYKAAKGNCKFIPIKLDDCIMPSLLLQNLYIDLYNYGFEVGLSQMFSVINGINTFKRKINTFSNVLAKIKRISNSKSEIEICAIHFQEPISHYAIIYKNDPENIILEVKSDGFHTGGHGKDVTLSDGNTYNYHAFGVSRATAPGFPVRIEIGTKDNSTLVLCGILKEVSENNFQPIEFIIKT